MGILSNVSLSYVNGLYLQITYDIDGSESSVASTSENAYFMITYNNCQNAGFSNCGNIGFYYPDENRTEKITDYDSTSMFKINNRSMYVNYVIYNSNTKVNTSILNPFGCFIWNYSAPSIEKSICDIQSSQTSPTELVFAPGDDPTINKPNNHVFSLSASLVIVGLITLCVFIVVIMSVIMSKS